MLFQNISCFAAANLFSTCDKSFLHCNGDIFDFSWFSKGNPHHPYQNIVMLLVVVDLSGKEIIVFLVWCKLYCVVQLS